MLAHLKGYVGPCWGYVGPSWGYVGASWRLYWPILEAMLAHLGQAKDIFTQNMLEIGGTKNTVNYRGFYRHAVKARGSAARGCNHTARGSLAGCKQYRPVARLTILRQKKLAR